MARRVGTPEGQLLRLILDWLKANHIFAMRLNCGAMNVEGRFVRFGAPPGTADILAFTTRNYRLMGNLADGRTCLDFVAPIWIEVKASTRQSEVQKSFQRQVEEAGHRYIVARSLEDVKAVLG